MTGLRLSRRRLLGGLGAVGIGAGGLYAVSPLQISASLTTYEYVLHVEAAARERADRVERLDQPVTRAVLEATDGGYETGDPSVELRSYFEDPGETRYVETNDGYYRLDSNLPVYVLWVEPVAASEATDPVTRDELEACVHPDDRGYVPPPTPPEAEPLRTYHLDPAVRSCIDRHPYLEFESGDVVEYHLVVEDPGPPYTVDATPVSAREVADVPGDASVVQWTDLSEGERELVATADQESIRRQSLTDAVRSLADRYDFVHRDDEFLSVDLDRPGTVPISVDVSVTDAESREFDPAWLELAVRNESDEPLMVESEPPAPFGDLLGKRLDGRTDDELTLWWRGGAAEGEEAVFAGDVVDMSLSAVIEQATVPPGETVTRRYALRRNPGRLATGVYRFDAGFVAGRPDDDGDEQWAAGPMRYPVDLDVTVSKPG